MRLFKGLVYEANDEIDVGVIRLFCLILEARGDEYNETELYQAMVKRFPKDKLDKKIKRKCGDVLKMEHIIYLVGQLLPGEPKHYDSESNRLDTFKLCMDQLEQMITQFKRDNPEIKKIQLAIPYLFGTLCKENWKLRKRIMVEFEKKCGVEFVVFVDPNYIESQKSDKSD